MNALREELQNLESKIEGESKKTNDRLDSLSSSLLPGIDQGDGRVKALTRKVAYSSCQSDLAVAELQHGVSKVHDIVHSLEQDLRRLTHRFSECTRGIAKL